MTRRKAFKMSVCADCETEVDSPPESAELFFEAIKWAKKRYGAVAKQISGITLHLDRETISVSEIYGESGDAAEGPALGLYVPSTGELHVACHWANASTDHGNHTSPLDVLFTLFHEVGHAIQDAVGTCELANVDTLAEFAVEKGADEFAARAFVDFMGENYQFIRDHLPKMPEVQKQLRPRKKDKTRTSRKIG